jgi:hypothetical protein
MKFNLPSEDRLALLQTGDQFRSWDSLDDKRFCILCERTFNGRQVSIRHRRGRHELRCPTESCKSQRHQWVHPRNSLNAEKSYQDWWRAPGGETDRPKGRMAGPSLIFHHA